MKKSYFNHPKRKIQPAFIFVLFILPLLFNSISLKAQRSGYDKLQVDNTSIDAKGAKYAKVLLDLVGGEMTVRGGAKNLMDGRFTYSRERWEPEIEYDLNGNTGILTVRMQKDRNNFSIGKYEQNEWDVKLDENIPMDLRIKLLGGVGKFDLEDMNLENFSLRLGGGEFDINLANTSLPKFTMSALAGEAFIDLGGRWKNDLEAEFNCGFGELTLYLPENTGVRLVINGVIGEVNYHGFSKRGKIYTNKAYNNTDFTLFIEINSGIGVINLELVD